MGKDRLIPCLIHIPCQYPGGEEVEAEKMNAFLEALDRQFNGSTPLGIVPGRWVSPEGQTVVEPMQRVEVSVLESAVSQFERVARVIGRETKQKAMYVVVNYQAETRLLWTDDDDNQLTANG